jgi:uncharacterized membrane protein YhiD involved in acid resistance
MPTNTKNEGYGTGIFLPMKWVPLNKDEPAPVGISREKFDSGGNGDSTEHTPRKDNSKPDDVHPINPDSYFTEFTVRKAFLYLFASLYVIGCGAVSVMEMFIDVPCPVDDKPIKFANPAYDGRRCPHIRQPILLGLTPLECSFGRRLVISILLGGLIGWERRQADRPAGIRTMSLVSLGSCLFTINSAFAFIDGPMEWDASRISAAIPSGVGFLGAGLIFKKTNDEADNMVVHGLTTAASVWLSAAVGIACGGELYFAASFGTCLMMLLLRFGPRGSDALDDDADSEEVDAMDEEGIHDDEQRSVPFAIDSTDESSLMNLPPGLQMTSRSYNDGKSMDGSYTVTGESIENVSVAAETTPMLPQQQGSQATLTAATSSRSHSQLTLQQRRNASAKSSKVRKRQSKGANLGTIV